MKKKNFRVEMILNKQFSTELSGYNPTEVDQFFDKIIEDYRTYDERETTLNEKIEAQDKIINDKDEKIEELKMDILNLNNQLKQTEKASNYEVLKAIRNLEEKVK